MLNIKILGQKMNGGWGGLLTDGQMGTITIYHMTSRLGVKKRHAIKSINH